MMSTELRSHPRRSGAWPLASALLLTWAAAACTSSSPPDQLELEGQAFSPYDPAATGDLLTTSATQISPSLAEATPLTTLTRDELALALRPAVFHPTGQLFIADEPNYDAADDVLDGIESPTHVVSPSGQPRDGAPLAGASAPLILGSTDDRNAVLNPDYPRDAIARVLLYADVDGDDPRGWCTASFIGPWTALLAGHCLRFPDGEIARRLTFETARHGTELPFNSFTCVNGDASSSNDLYWAVPAGFMEDMNPALDFAVIDTYPCDFAPAEFDGYIVNALDLDPIDVYGYSVDACEGVPDLEAYEPGTYQCGMRGSAQADEWRLQSDHIDTDAGWATCPDDVLNPPPRGMSGAPWYFEVPPPINSYTDWRVAGVDIGFRVIDDPTRCNPTRAPCVSNVARRIDDTFDAFIRFVSFDF